MFLPLLNKIQEDIKMADSYIPNYLQGSTITPTSPMGTQSVVSGATSGAGMTSNDLYRALMQSGMSYGEVQTAVMNFNRTGELPASMQSGDSDLTVIGQGEAWLTPDELNAKNNALQTGSTYGSSGGGGGGSSGGISGGTATTSAGGGLNLSGASGGTSAGGPSFTDSGTANTPMLNYQSPGITTSQQGGVLQGQQGAPLGQPGALQMQQANPQSALDQYKNTAGYQLLNAPGAYQQSPGYQYAMDQAMNQVQQQAAGRGMLESGAVLKNMQQTASGLAQQDYGNWWNRQNQLYSDYQNRLQGLAGGPTGSQDAMTANTNAAQANLQTGSNIGSLFGNQGTSGMGGIINTGAAQAGNMINAGQQQAQVNAANQSTQLAGATLSQQGLF